MRAIAFRLFQGFPPFSGSTPEETWANLKNWQRVLRRPVYDKPEDLIFNLTDQAWDAVIRYVGPDVHLARAGSNYRLSP